MLKKIRENKGFTLAELLVVVAIIGILVAVSIPIFTAQLEKARIATNQANIRAAKAAAVAAELNDNTAGLTYPGYYVYTIKTGAVAARVTAAPTVPTATGSIYQTINVQVNSDNTIKTIPYDTGTGTTVADKIKTDNYN